MSSRSTLFVVLVLLVAAACAAPFPQWHPTRADWDALMGDEPNPSLGTFVRRVREVAKDLLVAHGYEAPKQAKEYPYWSFLPPFVGRLVPGGPPLTWSNSCFKHNSATATMSADNSSVTVTVTAQEPGLLCSDLYLFGTTASTKLDLVDKKGSHSFTWQVHAGATAAEQWDVMHNGVRVFRFVDNWLQTIADVVATLELFFDDITRNVPDWVAARNIDFLEKYSGFQFPKRSSGEVEIDESLIQSGDFLGVLRLDGIDPMLAWAMGSTTGHTTVALRFPGEGLYICESTIKDSYWPTGNIQRTPFAQWISQAKEAGFQVVWAPLSDENRAKFNATAAIEKFREIEGMRYGFNNLLFGWLDTATQNYPCIPPDYTQCLEWEHIPLLVGALERLAPDTADMIFLQALNHRLNTTGLKMAELLQRTEAIGLAQDKLPTIVEQDSWTYNTTRYHNESVIGPSMVCCVFVCNMWKAGGLFDSVGAENINCAELTNFDDYSMHIFQKNFTRPAQCAKADPNNPVCQLMGEYELQLNRYNSLPMYAHMAEHCPSEAPKYERPANC